MARNLLQTSAVLPPLLRSFAFENGLMTHLRNGSSRVRPSARSDGCRSQRALSTAISSARTTRLYETRGLAQIIHRNHRTHQPPPPWTLSRRDPAPQRQIWSAAVVGREPGIDYAESPDQASKLQSDATIRVVDFASSDIVQHEIKTHDLEAFLRANKRPTWAACRWIYVNGLNYNTVRCLGRNNALHHLALEDVLEKGTPVKADWYDNHCFMVLALQKLEQISERTRHRKADFETAKTFRNASLQNREHGRANARLYHFREQPFAMDIEQAFMFLTTDNTVITIFERSGEEVFAPIMRRLESSQTVMRSSNDPSMLVQGIIDTVVDLSIPIGKAVGAAFAELEEAVLSQPEISQSKQLYVLRSGLTILMDNISANGSVVRELISHRGSDSTENAPSPLPATKPNAGVTISPMAQIYLQDVQDHIRTLANSTHMSIRSAENLTSLIFNTIAASQNESVRQLTIISCFFLPLTFLTGYFGMNFDPMPVVNEHSDAFFWWIAGPMIAAMSFLMLSRTLWVRSRAWKRRKRHH